MKKKKNSPPIPHLLQAQQALALPHAKVVGCPGTGSYPAPSLRYKPKLLNHEIWVTVTYIHFEVKGCVTVTHYQLELVFIKHDAPNNLPLTVNNHHVLFVKRLLFLCFIIFLQKFSKGHNSGKQQWIVLKKFNQVIYSSSPISWPSFKPIPQIVSKISCWQV